MWLVASRSVGEYAGGSEWLVASSEWLVASFELKEFSLRVTHTLY